MLLGPGEQPGLSETRGRVLGPCCSSESCAGLSVWGIPGVHPRATAVSVEAAASGGSDVQPGGESLMAAGGIKPCVPQLWTRRKS